MEKNKIRAYLLYAIGEILLVVIRILIALPLNNRNESRKENMYLLKIYGQIRQNLMVDTLNLRKSIGSLEAHEARATLPGAGSLIQIHQI